jgi:hypothetical protein
MVCEHEYMNMGPLPPIIELATALQTTLDAVLHDVFMAE